MTGAQIVKINRVFFIQIQEGTIGPDGDIIDKPVWKNVSNFLVTDQWKTISEKVSNRTVKRHFRDAKHQNDLQIYTYNTVFSKTNFIFPVTYDWRSIHLDEINIYPQTKNHVITAIQFHYTGDGLSLRFRSTLYDRKTGKLLKDYYRYWSKFIHKER